MVNKNTVKDRLDKCLLGRAGTLFQLGQWSNKSGALSLCLSLSLAHHATTILVASVRKDPGVANPTVFSAFLLPKRACLCPPYPH